jgi:C4-dicarboxylate transporter
MDTIKSKLQRMKENQEKLRKDVLEKTIGYILTAFGFVAGLAWNDAIKALIDDLFPLDKNGIVVKFVYAVLVTLMVVMVTILFVKKERAETKK